MAFFGHRVFLRLLDTPSPAFWIQAAVARHLSTLVPLSAFLLHGYHALLILPSYAPTACHAAFIFILFHFLAISVVFLLSLLPLHLCLSAASGASPTFIRGTKSSIRASQSMPRHLTWATPLSRVLRNPSAELIARVPTKTGPNKTNLPGLICNTLCRLELSTLYNPLALTSRRTTICGQDICSCLHRDRAR